MWLSEKEGNRKQINYVRGCMIIGKTKEIRVQVMSSDGSYHSMFRNAGIRRGTLQSGGLLSLVAHGYSILCNRPQTDGSSICM